MNKYKNILLVIIFLIFISLGLPDAILGAAWPEMHIDLKVDLAYGGIVSFTISICTVISSLLSDKINRHFKAGVICAASTVLTVVALFGFSICSKFWMVLLCCIPYGLGAGAIDSTVNNYVAVNYESKHMSWLHAMWGIGTIFGPYAMGLSLTVFEKWNYGYVIIGMLQILLCIMMFTSIPLWKKSSNNETEEDEVLPKEKISLKDIFKIKGVLPLLICFLCYCALESTANLWGSSYLVYNNNINSSIAASLASMFLIGLTVGRILNGFLAIKWNDDILIKLGIGIIFFGIILLFIPYSFAAIPGFVFVGLGCAPIYPSIMHSIPIRFGKRNSQLLIGLQMAFAYLGSSLMPPLFGMLSSFLTVSFLPFFLLIILFLMFILHNIVIKKTTITKK